MDKEKKIVTENFKIERNIVSFNDFMLQIRNITSVNVEPIPKKKFNLWAIIIFIIGVLVLILADDDYKIIGIFFLIVAVSYLLIYIILNFDGGERYLQIYMNSGHIFYIYCENEKFLKKVLEIIEYCFNYDCTNQIKIDFKNCKLYNSPLIVGDRNEVK